VPVEKEFKTLKTELQAKWQEIVKDGTMDDDPENTQIGNTRIKEMTLVTQKNDIAGKLISVYDFAEDLATKAAEGNKNEDLMEGATVLKNNIVDFYLRIYLVEKLGPLGFIIFGFIGGVVIAVIYNYMMLQRRNLFGGEANIN